ncbi:uncharacterized protein N7503_007587 [Penicillium pulvis]|uniref:uncharacterized protein n=1 Tax=Penicillium pulvis TaxID=1562058 RepID=UPI0025483326|nr:uncharacterized protein N7503_007587 [Penicillium pulvis]KAJ5798291.1 hypothetical protein N7503_007587 [Penicillium pulvis]
MSYNYSHSFIEDLLGFSEYESAPLDAEWAPLGYGPLSLGTFTNAAPIPDDPNTSRSLNAKVPIPRASTPGIAKAHGRVSRACEACREQKAKCSGHQPTCNRCAQSGAKCSYGDRKREKIVKQLTDLTIRAQTFEDLLRTLHPQLDTAAAELIEQALTTAPIKIPKAPQLPYGSVFALGAFDCTQEDLNQDSRLQSMGFIGEPSEMACLYRLKRQLDQSISTPTCNQSISHINYFLDDADVVVDQEVDLSKWPSQAAADLLVHHYFDIIHPTFPAIGKLAFISQYRKFYSSPNVRPGSRWRAVLNLIFAIAARHLLLTSGKPSVEFEDDLVFFSRAWHLNMDKEMALEHPDLQQVQIEGLMSFYMLSVGHINRSWRMIGVAIRSAITMGINLRNVTETVPPLSKETRYRLWWALITLEMVLCEMTGRPTCTGVNFCTTPLPVPYPEEDFGDERIMKLITDQTIRSTTAISGLPNSSITSLDSIITASAQPEANNGIKVEPEGAAEILIPNSSLCLLYAVELSLLMRDAVTTLYAPTAAQKSWHGIEIALCTLNDDADRWLSRLPVELQFKSLRSGQPFLRQRISLAFQFYSTKLVISQSCLRPIADRLSEVKPVVTLCENMATMCVKMAGLMLDILPDKPDMAHLEDLPPWWVVFHYLMQSTVVHLVELFTRAQTGTPEAVGILKNIGKATGWLEMMSSRDRCSKRAWVVCMDLLSTHGAKLELEADSEK